MSEHSSTLLLFGATGDLARRMLLPSLYALHSQTIWSPTTCAFSVRRVAPIVMQEYRDLARAALCEFLPDDRKEEGHDRRLLTATPCYQSLDASKPEGFGELATKIGDISGGLSIFLSTAPSLFEPTIKGLDTAPALAGENVRIGLEKPLGSDLDLQSSCAYQRCGQCGLPRSAHLPHRPLSRQGDGAEPDGAPLCQHAVRTACGTPMPSSMCRSRSAKPLASKGAPVFTTILVPCAIWCRTICCNCSR